MTHETSVTRKPVTRSIEEIERVALEIFRERGFEDTPVEDIAAAVGISRRTFFRYFGSKSDILFGNFQSLLRDMDEWLAAAPADRPMFEVIADAVTRFNRLHSDGPVAHRERMELILHTPALRANAALHNAEWAAVIARYAARRMGAPPDELGPQLAGFVSLGAASAAYEQWLRDASADLAEVIDRAFRMVQTLPALEAPSTRRPPRS